jgi:hypothetical protein
LNFPLAPFGDAHHGTRFITELLVHLIMGSPMEDAARVRDRAVRLYALALQARERGYTSASELERLANEAMAHAEELERRPRIVPPPADMPQQVAQQQQQPQPKKK